MRTTLWCLRYAVLQTVTCTRFPHLDAWSQKRCERCSCGMGPHRVSNRHTDTQTYRHTDTQTHRHTHTTKDTLTHQYTKDRHVDKHTSHMDTYTQIHRHTYTQCRSRHTNTETHSTHTDTTPIHRFIHTNTPDRETCMMGTELLNYS